MVNVGPQLIIIVTYNVLCAIQHARKLPNDGRISCITKTLTRILF